MVCPFAIAKCILHLLKNNDQSVKTALGSAVNWLTNSNFGPFSPILQIFKNCRNQFLDTRDVCRPVWFELAGILMLENVNKHFEVKSKS